MRSRDLMTAAAALALAAVAGWLFLARPGASVPPSGRASVGAAATPAGRRAADGRGPGASVMPEGGRGAADAAGGTARGGEGLGAPDSGRSAAATMPLEDEPLALVNGVPLTMARVFPPGVMRAGDQMPRSTYEKFLDEAVNRAVVVQEAERRGYADTPEFKQLVGELRDDVAGLSNLSPEEREWQANELRELALADRLYREEGIVPRKVTPEEVDAYYRQHAAEYDWVRRREEARGATPERIERRVREEIRRDLQGPVGRETQQQREALARSLRDTARVEIP